MATIQAKRLKQNLKSVGITDRDGKVPSCRTATRRIQGCVEYGDAVAHTVALTDEQINDLKKADPYIKISNFPEYGFAIIEG